MYLSSSNCVDEYIFCMATRQATVVFTQTGICRPHTILDAIQDLKLKTCFDAKCVKEEAIL